MIFLQDWFECSHLIIIDAWNIIIHEIPEFLNELIWVAHLFLNIIPVNTVLIIDSNH